MKRYSITIDTNVLLSSLKSRKGASFRLISLIGSKKFDINLSVSLVFEYEDVLKRKSSQINLNNEEVDDILDYLCKVGNKCEVFYLWRPFLKDPKDDFILELAVESLSDYIITYNKKDFGGIEKFGVEAVTPIEFLKLIGKIK